MSLFAIDNPQQILDGLNYAISNLPNNDLQANIQTGIITRPNSSTPYAYLYQYLHVRYADSSNPTTIYTSPTNRTWYGLQNTDSLTGSTNPQDYVWYQPSNPFSTNYFLYYSTIGGRQILTQVATTSPGSTWLQTQDGVPIDLDIVIGSAADQLVVVNVYQRNTSAPATPTGGTYDFGNLVLTPPAGWSANIPAGNTAVYVSTNTFESDAANIIVPPVGAWTSPVVLVENGTDGQRGFIPLAYVLTPSDPSVANTATLSSWFSALRTNVSPPVGVSPDAGNIYTPVAGDTAQFYYANTNVSSFKTYTGTAWSDVSGVVIDGDVLISGTVSANALAANDIYTLRLQSTGADFGNNASQGFWLDATTGTARFGNSINIGNNLTVGNNTVIGNNLAVGANASIGNNLAVGNNIVIGANASIGGNLAVSGLVSAGNLIANTVATINIVPQAVTTIEVASSETVQITTSPAANTWYYVPNITTPTFTVSSTSDFVLFSGTAQSYNEYVNAGGSFFLEFYNAVYLYDNTANAGLFVNVYASQNLGSSAGTYNFPFNPVFAEYALTGLNPGNIYDASLVQRYRAFSGGGNITMNEFLYQERNITVKVVKR